MAVSWGRRRCFRFHFEAALRGRQWLETKPVIGEEEVHSRAVLQWLARGLPSGWGGGSGSRVKSRDCRMEQECDEENGLFALLMGCSRG
jgi:hypothetical protein